MEHPESIPIRKSSNTIWCDASIYTQCILPVSELGRKPPTSTVHVTSYLWNSKDFCGNPLRTSVKFWAEIRGSSVASPRNCLSGSTESSFGIRGIVFQESAALPIGCTRIRLAGVLQMIFGRPQVIESVKSSSGVRKIVFWKPYHPQSIGGLRKSLCNLLWTFHCNPLVGHSAQVHTEVLRIPSNVSVYSLWWFHGRFMEVRKLLRGISRKTYAANPRNSITNLWHVP